MNESCHTYVGGQGVERVAQKQDKTYRFARNSHDRVVFFGFLGGQGVERVAQKQDKTDRFARNKPWQS